ncbi:MAG: methionine--tRNA ligase [Actinobacteria bacterium HGW-Actinobacteria-1]|jgi:methionyl-tRNA synthetase|nr:MAG: methionine--tRNA ligase [Actinobacteria bacterium HGW-Actinobacteria-1]
MSDKTFYVTTPIYYVNAEPHLGTAYTTVAADAVARYRRMTGHDVMFLTGLDEHGQKIAQAAEENGMEPQAWVDAIAPKFEAAWKMLGISYDDFIRTTEPRHKKGVQAFWTELHDRGYLYQGNYEGWYCVPDETYWTEEQLEDGKCPQCGRDVQFIKEDNWFFKLSEFQQPLLDFYESHPGFVQPETRRNEVLSFVKGGLKDLSISRTNFTWGVPLPFAEDHVTYVWIDALLNYITALGYGGEDHSKFDRYWPADYNFVGKDIIRFHCVIWPAMLMAAGVEPPKAVFAHGFLLTKGEKMSKSKGNAQTPASLVERFGVDAYRYYFLRDVQFGQDGSISMESMVQRYNGDLANDWGNLVSRLLNMTEKYLEGLTPTAPTTEPTDADKTLRAFAGFLPEKYEAAMSRLDYGSALEAAWDLIKDCNRYIENEAPWTLAKEGDTDRLAAVLYNTLEAVRIAALYTAPVMPNTSAEVWTRLGLGDITSVTDIVAVSAWGQLPSGLRVTKGEALFPRIYEEA